MKVEDAHTVHEQFHAARDEVRTLNKGGTHSPSRVQHALGGFRYIVLSMVISYQKHTCFTQLHMARGKSVLSGRLASGRSLTCVWFASLGFSPCECRGACGSV